MFVCKEILPYIMNFISDEYMLYVRDEIMLLDIRVRGSITKAVKTIGPDNLQQIALPLLDSQGREVETQLVWLTNSLHAVLTNLKEANAWPTVGIDQKDKKKVYLPDKLVFRVFGNVKVAYY